MTQDNQPQIQTVGTIDRMQRVLFRNGQGNRLRVHLVDTAGNGYWYTAFKLRADAIERAAGITLTPTEYGVGEPTVVSSGQWVINYTEDDRGRTIQDAKYNAQPQPQQQPQIQPQPQAQAQPQAQPQVQPLTKEEQIARAVGIKVIADLSGINSLAELEQELPQIKRILDQLGPMVFSSSYKLVSDEKILDEDYEV